MLEQGHGMAERAELAPAYLGFVPRHLRLARVVQGGGVVRLHGAQPVDILGAREREVPVPHCKAVSARIAEQRPALRRHPAGAQPAARGEIVRRHDHGGYAGPLCQSEGRTCA